MARPSYKWLAYFAIAVGLFTSVADNGSVVVALPTISKHFATDLTIAQWVVVGFALTVSALLLPMGRLSDIVGRKQVYVSGFTLFVAASFLAGFGANLPWLVGARIAMGVGAAMTQGTAMAIVLSAFPEEERGKALGLQMSVVGVGGVGGPVMGGLIVSAFGWRGVFFTTAALGLVAIAVAQTVLVGRRGQHLDRGARFDWVGAGLSSLVLVTFLLAVTNGARVGWASALIVAALVGFGALLGALVWWELRVPNPMLDMRLFRRGLFAIGAVARFGSFIGISSIRFLMPFFLQAVQGYTPRQVGLIVVPSAIAMIVTGPLGGRLSDRYGTKVLNVGGLAVSAAGLLALSRLTGGTSIALIVGAMVVQSSGIGLFGAPNSSSMLSVVEPERFGVVSGFLNLIRNSANVTGVAAATAVVAAVMASQGVAPTLAAVGDAADAATQTAFVSGLRLVYMASGAVVLLGAGLSLFGRTPRVEGRAASD